MIAATKQVTYESINAGMPKHNAAILVDKPLGCAILRGAEVKATITACAAETRA